MKLDRERKGEIFTFTGAFLWSLFPVVTVITYNSLDPLISLATSTFFASILFALVLTYKKSWHNLLNRSAIKDILSTTFILGIGYYLLFFFGLRYTSPGNASIISLSEIFFSYLLFHVWKKDHIPTQHIIGSVLMILGALIVLYPNMKRFQLGDFLIVGAAFVAPFGNYFAQRARSIVNTENILFIRSFISTIFIFSLSLIFHKTFSVSDLKTSLFFLIINGVFLLGISKIMWVESIHRISVTKANALSSIGPLFTILFAWLFLKDLPTVWQLTSFIPMFFGVILLGKNKKREISTSGVE